MNKLIIWTILAVWMGISACEEDERGPLTNDGVPPSPVTEVGVTNLPGGAKITYTVPSDQDALLVQVTYKLDNGKVVTSKSSIFKNHVVVEGLREIKEQVVELVTVDRSNNHSEPVNVTILPETAPIDKLYSSFELDEDFGGVRLKYNNEDQVSAELLLYAEDDSGNLIYQQSTFISDDQKTHQTFRGFPPLSKKFGVAAIDRWDNSTDIMEAVKTPLEEVLLNIENFRDVFLTGDESEIEFMEWLH